MPEQGVRCCWSREATRRSRRTHSASRGRTCRRNQTTGAAVPAFAELTCHLTGRNAAPRAKAGWDGVFCFLDLNLHLPYGFSCYQRVAKESRGFDGATRNLACRPTIALLSCASQQCGHRPYFCFLDVSSLNLAAPQAPPFSWLRHGDNAVLPEVISSLACCMSAANPAFQSVGELPALS